MNEAHIIVTKHLRASPDGEVVLAVSGSGLATVTLRSARPIAPRWLGRGRPRLVVLGMRRVAMRPDALTTVAFKLSRDHLALLHRMQTDARHRPPANRRRRPHAPDLPALAGGPTPPRRSAASIQSRLRLSPGAGRVRRHLTYRPRSGARRARALGRSARPRRP